MKAPSWSSERSNCNSHLICTDKFQVSAQLSQSQISLYSTPPNPQKVSTSQKEATRSWHSVQLLCHGYRKNHKQAIGQDPAIWCPLKLLLIFTCNRKTGALLWIHWNKSTRNINMSLMVLHREDNWGWLTFTIHWWPAPVMQVNGMNQPTAARACERNA